MRFEVLVLMCVRNIKGIGKKRAYRFSQLLQTGSIPQTPRELYELLHDVREKLGDIEVDLLQLERCWRSAEVAYTKSIEAGIHMLSIYDENYPRLLRNISDPPVVLHVKGNLEVLSKPSVAVVGTRRPKPNTFDFARYLSNRLADRDVVIVSGLALGIDTAAHVGVLSSNHPENTIAVLGHGLGEKIYPAENASLAERILERGGALVSEYEVDVGVTPYNLVDRDRLQSGLSSAVIVIETSKDGGSMHTAKFCVQQERQLYAVDIPASGNQILIQENRYSAIPISISDSEEVLSHICESVRYSTLKQMRLPNL